MIGLAELWCSPDARAWAEALRRYWDLVQPANLDLERQMESLDVARIQRLDPKGWYDFLLHEYFRWKYTARNRYASTTKQLRRYAETDTLGALATIRDRLFTFDVMDIRVGLTIASEIRGLGPAGASGLLAVLFPAAFGTADQFVVKALRTIPDLPEAAIVAKMKPDQLTLQDAAELIATMRRKAAQLNHALNTSRWTPRMIDKVLWAIRQ